MSASGLSFRQLAETEVKDGDFFYGFRIQGYVGVAARNIGVYKVQGGNFSV